MKKISTIILIILIWVMLFPMIMTVFVIQSMIVLSPTCSAAFQLLNNFLYTSQFVLAALAIRERLQILNDNLRFVFRFVFEIIFDDFFRLNLQHVA